MSTQVALDLVKDGHDLAGQGDIKGATAKFEQALGLEPDLGIEPEVEAKRSYAPKVVEDARTMAKGGDIEGAVAMFKQALTFDPRLSFEPEVVAQIEFGRRLSSLDAYTQAMITLASVQTISPTFNITTVLSANEWNEMCWQGSLTGTAASVLPACERAVVLTPEDGSIRDSRGLARALTGDIEGAIADFEFYIQWRTARDEHPERVAQRQEWIAALKAGQNPFDVATLAKLRDSE